MYPWFLGQAEVYFTNTGTDEGMLFFMVSIPAVFIVVHFNYQYYSGVQVYPI